MKTGSRSDKTWYKYCVSSIKRTSHAVYDLKYHMVWVPKYRKMILKGDLAKRVREVFLEIAERYEFEIDTMEVKEDHVHLFLSAPPRYSPAGVVQIIKSISAKEVFKEFPEVKKQLWGGEFWSDRYFVRSVGDKVTSEVIRRYIKYQHHEQLSFDF
jgi:putative transposase